MNVMNPNITMTSVAVFALEFANSPPICAVTRFEKGEHREPNIIPHIPAATDQNCRKILQFHVNAHYPHSGIVINMLIC